MEQTTIAAIATPLGTGGVGMVRLSGPGSLAIGETVFRSHSGKALSSLSGYTGTLGMVMDGEEPIDEAIAFVCRAPRSYTGEDVVELTCHGGSWITSRVLRLCLERGAVPAEPGEFTRRAFLGGRIDLMQAESVMDLIAAEGEGALRAALERTKGELSTKIGKIVESLTAQSAHLTAWADYPEEDIIEVDREALAKSLREAKGSLDSLLSTYDRGRVLAEGLRTVILGKPNVGKSTLMNLLSGQESSIVTDLPGTTRDVVSERVRIGGITLRLSDTAGLRDTEDPVEKIGVSRAWEQLELADLTLAVFDSSDPLDDRDRELLSRLLGRPAIALINKADLPPRLELEEVRRHIPHLAVLSARTGEGYGGLEHLLREMAGLANAPDQTVIANERQRLHLSKASEAVGQALEALEGQLTLDAVGVCMEEALDQLLRLTGERVTDRVLDEVFSRFCVGK